MKCALAYNDNYLCEITNALHRWIPIFPFKIGNFRVCVFVRVCVWHFVWFSVIQILQLCIKDYNKINKRFDFPAIFIQLNFCAFNAKLLCKSLRCDKAIGVRRENGLVLLITMSSTYYRMKCLLTTGFSVLCTFT